MSLDYDMVNEWFVELKGTGTINEQEVICYTGLRTDTFWIECRFFR